MKTLLSSTGFQLPLTIRLFRSFMAAKAKILLGSVGLAAALAAPVGHAQPVLDCNCLAKLPVLTTNACCGFIPDLCPVATNCYRPSTNPAPGFTCTQNPPAGTYVCSSTLINFTIIENIT